MKGITTTTDLFQKLKVSKLLKIFPHFYGTRVQQNLAPLPHHAPIHPSPQLYIPILKIHCNYTLLFPKQGFYFNPFRLYDCNSVSSVPCDSNVSQFR
jgi:hypothetical protein